MADIVTLALEELEHRGGADALALAGRSVSGEADGTALIAEEQAIPTWRTVACIVVKRITSHQVDAPPLYAGAGRVCLPGPARRSWGKVYGTGQLRGPSRHT